VTKDLDRNVWFFQIIDLFIGQLESEGARTSTIRDGQQIKKKKIAEEDDSSIASCKW
jgi:hypothetical protein